MSVKYFCIKYTTKFSTTKYLFITLFFIFSQNAAEEIFKQHLWQMNVCDNETIITGTNDPSKFLAILKEYLPYNPSILEAGSYDGKDAIKLANVWPAGTIYSIEPVPELYILTAKNVRNYENIFTYSFALSNKNGTASFVVSEEPNAPGIPSMSSSLLIPKDHLKHSTTRFPYSIKVPTITLDAWGDVFGVKSLDLLWLDLQGVELDVISASKKLFQTVKAIVLEIEFCEAYAGQPTLDQVDGFIRRNGFVRVARNFSVENVEKLNNGMWFGDAVYVRTELYNKVKRTK